MDRILSTYSYGICLFSILPHAAIENATTAVIKIAATLFFIIFSFSYRIL